MTRYQIETHERVRSWDDTDTYSAYWCEVWDTGTGETVFATDEKRHAAGKAEVRRLAADWVRNREAS